MEKSFFEKLTYDITHFVSCRAAISNMLEIGDRLLTEIIISHDVYLNNISILDRCVSSDVLFMYSIHLYFNVCNNTTIAGQVFNSLTCVWRPCCRAGTRVIKMTFGKMSDEIIFSVKNRGTITKMLVIECRLQTKNKMSNDISQKSFPK